MTLEQLRQGLPVAIAAVCQQFGIKTWLHGFRVAIEGPEQGKRPQSSHRVLLRYAATPREVGTTSTSSAGSDRLDLEQRRESSSLPGVVRRLLAPGSRGNVGEPFRGPGAVPPGRRAGEAWPPASISAGRAESPPDCTRDRRTAPVPESLLRRRSTMLSELPR